MKITATGTSDATIPVALAKAGSSGLGKRNWCVNIQISVKMTVANKPVTTANRPQPSDPQKPQGRSSASRRGARADSGLACGRSKVATIVDMAVDPRLNAHLWCRPATKIRTAHQRVYARLDALWETCDDQTALIDS